MKKISVVSLLFAAFTSPIFASNTFLFLDIRASNQNFEVYQGQEYDMSPYTGALGPNANGTGGTSVQLFCDDFSDDSNYGTGWQVNVTTVDSADLSKTRYGSANANPAFPSGTTLYEEIAWLFTQSAAPGQTLANQDAIQEAVWDMTYPTGTPKATATASSPNMTYLQWIGAAESD